MSKRDARRAQRIVEKVHLGEVLSRLRYAIDSSNPREQQFRCDLHGTDHKPSARFYPSTNSTYCWVCHKGRDSIDYVREKEGLSFTKALDYLEHWFHLDPLPWEEEGAPQDFSLPEFAGRTPLEALESILMILTREKTLGLENTLTLWEVFDRLQCGGDQNKAVEVLGTVRRMAVTSRL